MKQFTKRLEIRTEGKGLYEISDNVVAWVRATGLKTGLLTVFIQHTSASLTIQENADPDVIADLNDHFNRLAPERSAVPTDTIELPLIACCCISKPSFSTCSASQKRCTALATAGVDTTPACGSFGDSFVAPSTLEGVAAFSSANWRGTDFMLDHPSR
jgi:hypothetical protein